MVDAQCYQDAAADTCQYIADEMVTGEQERQRESGKRRDNQRAAPWVVQPGRSKKCCKNHHMPGWESPAIFQRLEPVEFKRASNFQPQAGGCAPAGKLQKSF